MWQPRLEKKASINLVNGPAGRGSAYVGCVNGAFTVSLQMSTPNFEIWENKGRAGASIAILAGRKSRVYRGERLHRRRRGPRNHRSAQSLGYNHVGTLGAETIIGECQVARPGTDGQELRGNSDHYSERSW